MKFNKFKKLNIFGRKKKEIQISKREASIVANRILKKYDKTFRELAKYDRENDSYSLSK